MWSITTTQQTLNPIMTGISDLPAIINAGCFDILKLEGLDPTTFSQVTLPNPLNETYSNQSRIISKSDSVTSALMLGTGG